MILHQLQLPQNQSVLITSCNKGAELAVPNCVVALLAARGGILLGVDLITCSSLNQGGGGFTNYWSPPTLHPAFGAVCSLAPCGGLKGLLYSFNGEFCYSLS